MGKVSVMGTLTCQDGKAEEMEAVLTAMVEAARGEPDDHHPDRGRRPRPLMPR